MSEFKVGQTVYCCLFSTIFIGDILEISTALSDQKRYVVKVIEILSPKHKHIFIDSYMLYKYEMALSLKELKENLILRKLVQ